LIYILFVSLSFAQAYRAKSLIFSKPTSNAVEITWKFLRSSLNSTKCTVLLHGIRQF